MNRSIFLSPSPFLRAGVSGVHPGLIPVRVEVKRGLAKEIADGHKFTGPQVPLLLHDAAAQDTVRDTRLS